jgi:hypothetical protein
MSIKLVKLFANRVVERRNMINYYLRGRSSIESVGGVLILSFCFDFELFLLFWAFLSSSLPFFWLCCFSCLLLAFAVFLHLDDLLEFFLAFWVF